MKGGTKKGLKEIQVFPRFVKTSKDAEVTKKKNEKLFEL